MNAEQAVPSRSRRPHPATQAPRNDQEKGHRVGKQCHRRGLTECEGQGAAQRCPAMLPEPWASAALSNDGNGCMQGRKEQHPWIAPSGGHWPTRRMHPVSWRPVCSLPSMPTAVNPLQPKGAKADLLTLASPSRPPSGNVSLFSDFIFQPRQPTERERAGRCHCGHRHILLSSETSTGNARVLSCRAADSSSPASPKLCRSKWMRAAGADGPVLPEGESGVAPGRMLSTPCRTPLAPMWAQLP